MKDAKGHGSNTHGGGSAVVVRTGNSARGIMPSRPYRQGQPPVTSNAEAAQALMSGLKSTQAPVHDSMVGVGPNDPRAGSRDYDAFGRPRADKSSYDEYSRDLSLRSRNGQVGSGMRFRG